MKTTPTCERVRKIKFKVNENDFGVIDLYIFRTVSFSKFMFHLTIESVLYRETDTEFQFQSNLVSSYLIKYIRLFYWMLIVCRICRVYPFIFETVFYWRFRYRCLIVVFRFFEFPVKEFYSTHRTSSTSNDIQCSLFFDSKHHHHHHQSVIFSYHRILSHSRP